MALRHLLLIAGLTLSFGALAEKITLSANPGEFNAKAIGPRVSRGSLSASLRIVNFNGSNDWPTAAYVGFHQGPNRDNSAQFLIIRNRETDTYVVAGYRVIEDGREVKVESLKNLPLDAAARVSLSFDRGSVTLKLDSNNPVTFRTSLTEVSPYVSVSSGAAEFIVGP